METFALSEPVLLVLLSLAEQPRHGYSILKDIESMSDVDNEVTHRDSFAFLPLGQKAQLPVNANTLRNSRPSQNSKPEQIMRAYRILVKRFHPDLFPSRSNVQFEAEVRIGQLTQHTEFFQIRKTVSLRGESNKAEVALRRAKTGIL